LIRDGFSNISACIENQLIFYVHGRDQPFKSYGPFPVLLQPGRHFIQFIEFGLANSFPACCSMTSNPHWTKFGLQDMMEKSHFANRGASLILRLYHSMAKPLSYCEAVWNMDKKNVHVHYHDKEYGFPIADDNELFARLMLEINQAGLSWTTILNKKANFFQAYDQFDVAKVARYGQKQVDRLLNDAGIIRNRLKIAAAIENAKKILSIQKESGSFGAWIEGHHPLSREEWVKLFKKEFRFTGGEIVNEFLVSTGFLPGAHIESCPVYKKVLKHHPAWLKK
jgi:DNA-3-methyladenine glycosylase I